MVYATRKEFRKLTQQDVLLKSKTSNKSKDIGHHFSPSLWIQPVHPARPSVHQSKRSGRSGERRSLGCRKSKSVQQTALHKRLPKIRRPSNLPKFTRETLPLDHPLRSVQSLTPAPCELHPKCATASSGRHAGLNLPARPSPACAGPDRPSGPPSRARPGPAARLSYLRLQEVPMDGFPGKSMKFTSQKSPQIYPKTSMNIEN